MKQATKDKIGNFLLTIVLILGILILHTTADALTPIEPGCHERSGFTYCR